MIPKIIHRMWLDKNINDNNYAPSKYDKFIKTFNKHNKEFAVEFWNMTRVKNLFDKYPCISKYKSMWYSLPNHIQKCDVARFIILYLFGGIYIDLDFVCFKNLSPLLNREILLVFEPIEHSEIHKDQIERRLYNGFIGSVPNHPFWLEWLDFIIESLKRTSDVLQTSGPVNFRVFFNQSIYTNIEIVSTCDILPLYVKNNTNYITKDCTHRTRDFVDNYQNKMNNYVHTKWIEGSGWGAEKLEKPGNITYPMEQMQIRHFNYLIIFILIMIILVAIILIYLCIKKQRFFVTLN